MSNYPDGMSMREFDRATGGGDYQPCMERREEFRNGWAEVVLDDVEKALELIIKGDVRKGKDLLQEAIDNCYYDSNPRNRK